MKFLIITHVEHIKRGGDYFAYAPYVQEINLWLKHVDEVQVVAPLNKVGVSEIDMAYKHDHLKFHKIPSIAFISFSKAITSIFKLPLILFTIFEACKKADHIHIRCPGNIGLLGCLVQILFPKKIKTTKYAGNWDPESKQPFSYRLQKSILRNTFCTKNMSALVYGDWKETSKNIMPFFTASYMESEKIEVETKSIGNNINLLFAGTLSLGKHPLIAVEVLQELMNNGINAQLDMYGEGRERKHLEQFIKDNNLTKHVTLHGNKNKEVLKEAYRNAHFLVFFSKSEGWPKVITEAMFWKCLPISTKVSCISEMLGNGSRGSIITRNIDGIVAEIQSYKENENDYKDKVEEGFEWSRNYTLDKFELEIKALLQK